MMKKTTLMKGVMSFAFLFVMLLSKAQVTSSFTVNDSEQCLNGNSFVFTNTSSSGAGITYTWNFGDGTTSSATNPTKSYATAGYYSVELITDSNNIHHYYNKTVIVNPLPVASFYYIQATTTGNSYTFISTSTIANGVMNYFWDFGDGTTSTLVNPIKSYSATGTYNVKLVITSDAGCKDSVTQSVAINYTFNTPLSSSFTVSSNTSQCLSGNNFTFTNASSSGVGVTYLWNFGDGNTSILATPTHTYASNGNYTITLTVSSTGLADAVSTQSVTVGNPSSSFSVNNNGNLYSFSANVQTGATYLWDLGDATTSTSTSISNKLYSTGSYNVKLVVTGAGGCKDSTTQTITILPAPTSAFTVTSSSSQCQKVNLFTFNNTSTSGSGVTYHWNFGDNSTHNIANPTKFYSNPGTYVITLTVTTSGGSSISTATVTVLPSPNVSFSSSTSLNTVTFTNNSSIVSGSISSYNWDFGDGFNSASANPVKSFADGVYPVKLFATSNTGCVDSATQSITIGTLPTAAFNVTSITSQCSNSNNFTFNNTSSSGVGVTYLWNFGDGTTSALATPTKSYTTAGTFLVTLTVTTAVGSSTATQSVVVLAGPTVGFTTYSNTNSGSSFTFVSTSTVPAGTMTYAWDLGDGTTSTLVNPTKTYSLPGTYVVKLVVNGGSPCADSTSQSITVCPTVTARFKVTSATSQCLSGNSFTFIDSVTTNAVSGYSIAYNWSFGDSTFSSLQTPPAHTYATWGDYDVKLVVTLTSGACVAKDSITKLKVVSAEPMPVASYRLILDNFYVPTALLSDTTKRCWHHGYDFSYQSSSTLGRGIMDYFWHFGTSALYFRDGDSSHYINPRIVFDTAGTYPVQLMVVSDKGCKDSVTRIVELSDPRARFNFTIDSTTDIYATPVVSVTDHSYDYGGYLVAWNWSFGANAVPANSTSQTPSSFTYTCGGSKSVVLQVTSDVGCVVDTTRSFVIRIRPRAAFSISAPNYTPNVYARPTYTYTNSTTVNDACPSMTYSWNFGDGYSSTATSPTHIYKGSGTYTTTLIATNNNGGKKDTTTQTVTVLIRPRAIFSTSQTVTPNAYSAPTVTYTNTTSSQDTAAPAASLTYAWDFGDGSTSAVRFPPTHQYANGGTYTVRLIVNNLISGLADTTTQNVVIKFKPQAEFSSNVDYGGDIYSNPTVSFTDATTSNDGAPTYTYSWNFGDPASGVNNTSTLQNPTHIYTSGGTKTVTLTVTNTNGGLVDVISHNVVVTITPKAILSVHIDTVSVPVPMSIGNADYKHYYLTALSNLANPSSVVTGSILSTEITIDTVYIPSGNTDLYASVTNADAEFGIQLDTVPNYQFNIRLIVTSNLGVSDTTYATLGASESGFTAYRGANPNGVKVVILPSIGGTTQKPVVVNNPIVSKKGLSIYPNPAVENVTISLDAPKAPTNVNVMLYSSNGKLLKTQKTFVDNTNAAKAYIPVNISNLASDTYNVVLLDSKGVILGIGKCVKAKSN
ncbi:MAG: PKD domain-containing protein [Chitinophagaceae bacterium]